MEVLNLFILKYKLINSFINAGASSRALKVAIDWGTLKNKPNYALHTEDRLK